MEASVMDLSLTYLTIGGAAAAAAAAVAAAAAAAGAGGAAAAAGDPPPPPPSLALLCPWTIAHSLCLKELPLVGQLCLPTMVEDPCPPCLQLLPLLEEKSPDLYLLRHRSPELPLLWQEHEDGSAPDRSMDAAVWRHLPHDAIERIVAFLHVPDALRASIVSKQWKSITSSPKFLSLCAESPSIGAYFLTFQCEHGKKKQQQQSTWLAAYDPLASRWYSLTLNFLPSPPTAPFSDYTVVSSSGGLLCLWPEPRKPWKSVGLVVCNPVTRHWKELPCRCHDSRMPDLVAMCVDNACRSYKVVVLTEAVSDSKAVVATELYDSRTGTWKLTGVESSSGGKFKSTVVCGGKVFCIYEETPLWHRLKVYDIEEQLWKEPIPLPIFFYETQVAVETPEVLQCCGRLILVGRVGKHTFREEVVLWELKPSLTDLGKWKEVERMPQDIAREFLGCLIFGHYYCISRGDLIFFVASFKAPLLVYNFVKRTWHWWTWPFFEKYSNRFPMFGFVKPPQGFPPFGFALDLRFDAVV